MQINLYAVDVRFVSDAKGPLDDKPRLTVVTVARSHEEALNNAKARYADMERAGVVIEYRVPRHLGDTIAVELLALSGGGLP